MNGKQPIRRYKRRASGGTIAVIVLLIVVVLLAFACLVLAIMGKLDPILDRFFPIPPAVTEDIGDEGQTEPQSTNAPESKPETEGGQTEPLTETAEPSVTEPPETLPLTSGKWLDLEKTETSKGPLVLLDNDHPFTFPTEPEMVNLYTTRQSAGASKMYSLRDSSLELNEEAARMLNEMLVACAEATGKNDVMVHGAYRTEEYQQSLYDQNNGVNAFKGGCSDYHTGNAVYLKLFDKSGITRELESSQEIYSWFSENAHKYGFVMRYPEGKTKYTGTITDGEGHYRYVGVAHATAMHERNLCLEEYLTFLRDFSYEGNRLQVTAADGTYQIYSAVLSENGPTKMPEPAGNYTVSGDNQGAVIFLIKTGNAPGA